MAEPAGTEAVPTAAVRTKDRPRPMASLTHMIERTDAGLARAAGYSAAPASNHLAVDRAWTQDPTVISAKRFGHTTAPRPEEASP